MIDLLNTVADPNVAYTLMILGIWGLFVEFAHPGLILPGVIGVFSLLLAFYAFQLLPINLIGLGLILLGVLFMIVEGLVPSFGLLGLGGIIAFAIGSIMLIAPNTLGYHISLPLILALSIISAGVFLLILHLAVEARARPVVSGREELIGKETIVIIDAQQHIWVRADGELWQVRSKQPLLAGQSVKITGLDGNKLVVESTS